MLIRLLSKSGKIRGEVDMSPDAKIDELRQYAFKQFRLHPTRQRFEFMRDGKKVVLSDETKTFRDYEIDQDRIDLTFKDLGMQVGWRTVFFVEYFGPIWIHALVYFLPNLFYSAPATPKNLTQKIAFGLVMIHYLKREFESAFIHRFSNATMPWVNIFKNSIHYWFFGGISIAYFLYHPRYTEPFSDPRIIYALAGAVLVSEIGNLDAHIKLRNLRPPGTKIIGMPKGQLFSLVTCANYTWEISAWVSFAVLTSCLTSWVFVVMSCLPMFAWAQKKHRRLKKHFGKDYPRVRKAIIPFLY